MTILMTMVDGHTNSSTSTAIMPFFGMGRPPCNYGPVTRNFMADLQMLAKYPVYAMILNIVPYPYPVFVGVPSRCYSVYLAAVQYFVEVHIHSNTISSRWVAATGFHPVF